MSKTVYIPHDPRDTPQNYTDKMRRALAEAMREDRALHMRDVTRLEDDFEKGVRVLEVETERKYFFT